MYVEIIINYKKVEYYNLDNDLEISDFRRRHSASPLKYQRSCFPPVGFLVDVERSNRRIQLKRET